MALSHDIPTATRLRVEVVAGIILLLAGPALAVASFLAVGEARSWQVADAFARESLEPLRQVGMLLSVVGLAAVVMSVPALAVRVYGTSGFLWVLAGWAAFAFGTSLFMMALGLTAIALPALGELASSQETSAQVVVDAFLRQPPILAAFLGGNLLFLSWVPIGIGLGRSCRFPRWLGPATVATAAAGWLGFLHVPGIEVLAGPVWPLGIATIGGCLVRGPHDGRGRHAGGWGSAF
jgi:hypothetical protein